MPAHANEILRLRHAVDHTCVKRTQPMTTFHEIVPRLVVHADWGLESKNRWITAAVFNGTAYRVDLTPPSRRVRLSPDLDAGLGDDFETSQNVKDHFDAAVGLFSMLEVVLGRRLEGFPHDHATKTIEGWIYRQDAVLSNETAWPGITPENYTLMSPRARR